MSCTIQPDPVCVAAENCDCSFSARNVIKTSNVAQIKQISDTRHCDGKTFIGIIYVRDLSPGIENEQPQFF